MKTPVSFHIPTLLTGRALLPPAGRVGHLTQLAFSVLLTKSYNIMRNCGFGRFMIRVSIPAGEIRLMEAFFYPLLVAELWESLCFSQHILCKTRNKLLNRFNKNVLKGFDRYPCLCGLRKD